MYLITGSIILKIILENVCTFFRVNYLTETTIFRKTRKTV